MADAIKAAGGFAPNAASSAINPAEILRDGFQVYIPKKKEWSQRININIAPAWLLETLPGIGPCLAEKIINYRTQNGLFQSIEELKKVKGIGEVTFEKVKDKIRIS